MPNEKKAPRYQEVGCTKYIPSGHFVGLASLSEALIKKLHNQSAWLVRQCSALILIKVNSQALVPALSQQGLSRLGVNNTYSVVADTFTSSGGGAWIPVKPRSLQLGSSFRPPCPAPAAMSVAPTDCCRPPGLDAQKCRFLKGAAARNLELAAVSLEKTFFAGGGIPFPSVTEYDSTIR